MVSIPWLDELNGNMTVNMNTAELRDQEAAKAFIASSHVKVVFFLHFSEFWVDYALSCSNIKMVVVRPYNAFKENHRYPDETLWFRRGSREPLGWLLTYAKKYQGNPKVRWQFTNEPEHNQNDPKHTIAEQIKWIADHAESLAENRFGCAMGAWAAAKTILMENGKLINGEVWRPAVRVAEMYPEWVHMDFHEYKAIHLLVGYLKKINLGFPQTFLDWRALTDQNNWASIPTTGQLVYTNYYVGRRHAIREWAKANGFRGDYYEGMSEMPFDSMWEEHWKDFIDKTFEPLFGKPKGLPTLKRYMAWLHYMKHHPNIEIPLSKSVIDAAEAAYTDEKWCLDTIEQSRWWKKENGGRNLYNAWFAYTNNHEWRDNTDISQKRFQKLVDWMRYEQNGVDVTLPLEEEYIRSTAKVTFIRSQPNTNSEKIGSIPASGIWAVVGPEIIVDPEHNDGMDWRYVEIPNTSVRGYVAFAFIDRSGPPQDVVVEIRIKLTPEQQKSLAAQLKSTP